MSAETERIQALINTLKGEREEAERNFKKYEKVISRLNKILYISDNGIDCRLESITEYYIGTNGIYDCLEKNPQSAEGKFAQMYADRCQKNREEFTKNIADIRSGYEAIVRQYNTAVQRRDDFQQTISAKSDAIKEQQGALAQQKEKERQQEEAARRAAQEAARQAEEKARIAAEQQRAAQEAAQRKPTRGGRSSRR